MSFFRPKVTQAAPPPPPVIEDTAAKEQEMADALRRRQGRASQVLTGGMGGGRPMTAYQTLLGR